MKNTISNEGFSVAAIGNFDGVHLGHQTLFSEVKQLQKKYGGKTLVITFDPHPRTILTGIAPLLLTSYEAKEHMIHLVYDIDQIDALHFDLSFASMSAEKFVDKIIIEKYALRHIVVGFNFKIGKGGATDAQALQKICLERNVQTTIIPAVILSCGVVSSTQIRQKIEEGDIVTANCMLGYWYALEGQVMAGKKIGRRLGFATANIIPPENMVMPQEGVYAVKMLCENHTYDAVANYGSNPSVENGLDRPILEVHVLGQQLPDLYGKKIQVFFGRRIREERVFDNIDALQKQIAYDCQTADQFLSKYSEKQYLPKQIK